MCLFVLHRSGYCTAYLGDLSSPVQHSPSQFQQQTTYHINMAEPPSYEESTSGFGRPSDHKSDSKKHPQSSIKDEVDLSRGQHVAFVIAKIMEHIRERARQGLSKTTLALIPSDQGTLITKNASASSDTVQLQVEKARSLPFPTAKCRL